jgi:serine/threonine-protein phosphatase 5
MRLPINPTLGPDGRKRYYVVHGGLYSRDDVTLDTIRKIDRLKVKQPAGDTTMGVRALARLPVIGAEGGVRNACGRTCLPVVAVFVGCRDHMRRDPQDAMGRGPSKRGVGVGFGPDISRKWTEANGVTGASPAVNTGGRSDASHTAVLRSHEVQPEGMLIHHDGLCAWLDCERAESGLTRP